MSGPRTGPRAARHRALVQGLAAGGRAADADEQPRPRGRRAARRPRRLRRHRAGRRGRGRRSTPSSRALRDARGRRDLLVQSGKPVGVFRTHEWAPRVLIANSNLVPRLGDVGRVPPPRGARPDDVRPDDGGLVDLHRHPGDPAGHLRVLRRDRAAALRRLARRHDHADRRPRRHGRRAAAGGDDERRRGAVRRGRPRAHPAAARDALPRRGRRRPRRRGRALHRAPSDERRALSVGLCGNAAEVVPRAAPARLRGRHRHRPDQRPRPARRLRPRRPDARRGRRAAPRRPRRVRPPRARVDGRPLRRDGRLPGRRRRGLRLRQQPARRGRSWAASSARSTTPASCPPTSARCSARARARSAGSRCRATRPTSPPPTAPCSRSSPTTSASRRWIRMAGERIAFQGLPARICWLGYGERRRLGLRFNEMVRERRGAGADRDRARPPRLGLGRLAVPRDRGDGRRLRRDRRLAAPQRAGEHGRPAPRG